MLTAGKWALAIVPAGIALGALLSARPEPKEPPEPWWELTGRDEIAIAADGRQFVEAGPEDLSVYGGYRPDLDYEAEVWAAPIAEYDLAALLEDPRPAYDLPTVSYGVTAAEVVADAAEAAVDEAREAAAPAPAEEPAPEPGSAEVRKSELALAGLY